MENRALVNQLLQALKAEQKKVEALNVYGECEYGDAWWPGSDASIEAILDVDTCEAVSLAEAALA